MNNAFHRAVQIIKDRLKPISMGGTNPYVKTVLFGVSEEKDLYKKSIYPIAHIVPVSAPLGTVKMRTNAVNMFAFEVAVLDQRDISNSSPLNKFDGNDNLQDNLNITYAILNDLISYLKQVENDMNIVLSEVNDFSPVLFKDFNLLDGWVCRFVLMVPVIDPSDSNPAGSGGSLFDCDPAGGTSSNGGGGNGGGGNGGGGTSSNPNDNGEISCSTPIQYLYGTRGFFEASNPSISYQFADLDLATIIDYWEDNCTKGIGIGGAFMQKCGSGLEVGDEVFSSGGGDITTDGYYIADKSLPNSGTGAYLGVPITYRRNPSRPKQGYSPAFHEVFSEPCVIRIQGSIITEVHNLTTTEFCYTDFIDNCTAAPVVTQFTENQFTNARFFQVGVSATEQIVATNNPTSYSLFIPFQPAGVVTVDNTGLMTFNYVLNESTPIEGQSLLINYTATNSCGSNQRVTYFKPCLHNPNELLPPVDLYATDIESNRFILNATYLAYNGTITNVEVFKDDVLYKNYFGSLLNNRLGESGDAMDALSPGSTAQWKIRVKNSLGQYSEFSEVITVTLT
jgi:hypothetical protein